MKIHVNYKRAVIATKAIVCVAAVPTLFGCGTDDQVEKSGVMTQSNLVLAQAASGPLGSNANDFDALVAPSTMNHAVGWFPSVTNVTSVYTLYTDGTQKPGAYGLQLNSNLPFSTPICNGRPAGCGGWQQFIYTTSDWGIEYFLFGWGACPPGQQTPGTQGCCPAADSWGSWMYDGSSYCTKWVSGVPTRGPLPAVPITQLAGMKMQADAAPGSDTLTIYLPDGTSKSLTVSPSQAGLAYGWNEAGFNVFGFNGGQAIFNPGVTIKVETDVSGSTVPPRCGFDVTSGETTNLTLVSSSCCASYANGPRPPGITFTESNLSPLPEPDFCLLNDITPIGSPLL